MKTSPSTVHVICTFTCEGSVYGVAVAPDGRTIVAGDALGRVYVLRLEEGGAET